MQLIVMGNSKMGDKVACFSLPAVKTCRPSKWCLRGKDGRPACYALRGRMKWPNVIRGCELRYHASQKQNFVECMIKEIDKIKPLYFRLHVSGDFYSTEYVDKWYDIAKHAHSTMFRTTTRRVDFKDRIYRLNKLPNFVVRESIDPSSPKPQTRLPVAAVGVDIQPRYGRGQIQCSNNCVECGYKCWLSDDDEIFEEH